MKDLIRYLLQNRNKLPLEDWTVQGFGFMRLRIAESVRLHIWDSRLRTPEVSDTHDHTQWAFVSQIFSGQIVNVRYKIVDGPLGGLAQAFKMATLKCGIGGGMIHDTAAEDVRLLADAPEIYTPGTSYRQEPDEIHRTMAFDGTVTLLQQERREVDTARVFWPVGGKWGDAIPRQAERHEIDQIGGYALSIFPA